MTARIPIFEATVDSHGIVIFAPEERDARKAYLATLKNTRVTVEVKPW